ncbi:MAG: (S)-ureidoglycine aminohydrolase [Lachnospiraceae bacterium]|nr:(S)-ureidoglycine aminohydrolase [Lachnospiraceae bacterium]
MSYLNNQIGYRDELLATRSIIKKENYCLLEPDGLVKNRIPGYSQCDVTILGSPAMGASFADYLVTANPGGCNDSIGGEGIESFVYVIEGNVSVKNADTKADLSEGGYLFSPAGKTLSFVNNGEKAARLYVYRRRYEKLDGFDARTVVGNVNEMEWIPYEGMENCFIKDLLPSGSDWGFDMNMHILKFNLGASHGYIETHIQEHGMYFLSGKGMYRVDGEWIPVQKGDYLFLDAYCPQACYAVGREEDFTYIYSKDCNREVAL